MMSAWNGIDRPPRLGRVETMLKVAVLSCLIASLIALSQTEIWTLISETIQGVSGGFQISNGMLMISILLMVISTIMVFKDDEWESYTLILTWTVFIIAVYPWSGMDWLEALLGMGHLETSSSVGSMMLVGGWLMAVTLAYRSVRYMRQVTSNLMGRGVPTNDLEAIVDPMIKLNVKMIALTMALVSVVAITVLTVSGDLLWLEASPVTLMAVAMISVMTLVAVYLLTLRLIDGRASDR